MKACWCTLAGTKACRHCSNNTHFDEIDLWEMPQYPISRSTKKKLD